MPESCPICFQLVNEKAARLNAGITTLLVIVYLVKNWIWIFLILGLDFFIRGFISPRYSYFGYLSNLLLKTLRIKPSMVNAGPKVFAAKIGFVFCVLVLTTYFAHLVKLSEILAGVLGFFAALEALFGFCLACKIYPLLHRAK